MLIHKSRPNALVKIGVFSVALASALCLAACSSGTDAAASNSSTKATDQLEVLSYWTSGSESAALQTLFDDFTAAHPGVKITNAAVAGGGGSNAAAVLQSRIQGGNPPDTWQTSPGYGTSQYVDAGLLQPLDQIYSAQGWNSAMPKSLIDALTVNGHIYGVVTGLGRSNTLWYNKAVLQKAGIDPSSLKSMSDVAALTSKLQAQGVSTLCIGGQGGYGNRVLFENTLFSNLGTSGWKDLFSGKTKWTDPKVQKAVDEYLQSMSAWNGDYSGLAWNDAVQRVGAGKCAFTQMGDWAYGEFITDGFKYGTDFGYVAVPGTSGEFLANADSFSVSKTAKDLKNADAWVETIGNAKTQVDFAQKKGTTPINNKADVSSLSPYQQEAAQELSKDPLSLSFQQGIMAPASEVQAFSDALVQLDATKDAGTFLSTMANAAANGH